MSRDLQAEGDESYAETAPGEGAAVAEEGAPGLDGGAGEAQLLASHLRAQQWLQELKGPVSIAEFDCREEEAGEAAELPTSVDN